MNKTTLSLLAAAGLTCLLAGCASGDWHTDTGVLESDPHVQGQRDTDYDHLIVPGERIGPVALGGQVADAVQHLGEPDRVNRSTFRGPGYDGDEVYYYYSRECIRFTWMDSGVSPKIETGWRGITVSCDKWSTRAGVHVGMPLREALTRLANDGISTTCSTTRDSGTLLIVTLEGIWLEAKNRNSNVEEIMIMPRQQNFAGMGYKACD